MRASARASRAPRRALTVVCHAYEFPSKPLAWRALPSGSRNTNSSSYFRDFESAARGLTIQVECQAHDLRAGRRFHMSWSRLSRKAWPGEYVACGFSRRSSESERRSPVVHPVEREQLQELVPAEEEVVEAIGRSAPRGSPSCPEARWHRRTAPTSRWAPARPWRAPRSRSRRSGTPRTPGRADGSLPWRASMAQNDLIPMCQRDRVASIAGFVVGRLAGWRSRAARDLARAEARSDRDPDPQRT